MIFIHRSNQKKPKNKARRFLTLVILLSFIFSFSVALLQPVAVNAQTANAPAVAPTAPSASTATPPAKQTTTVEPGDTPSNFVLKILGGLLKPILSIEGWLIAVLTRVLMAVVKYNQFTTSPPVKIGWTLVRDIANLFFVVILLAIAIGTILKTESYNFKRLLPKLLIMAGLVNFSLVIAGLFLDFAQVIMMTFVSAFAAVTGEGNLVAALHVDQIIFYGSKYREASVGTMDLVITLLLMVIMLMIVIIVLLVMLVVFVMRIVMLWLLLVLAPLSYIMAAWGGGRAQRYYQQWWDEFFKYVMVGPVLAFFLWLALAVGTSPTLLGDPKLSGSISAPNFDPGVTASPNEETGMPITPISEPAQFVTFVIVISLLMASLMITQQLGVAGGSFAGNMMGKIRGAGMSALTKPFNTAVGLGKVSARAAGRVWDRGMARYSTSGKFGARVAGFLSPTTLKEGWKASRQTAERESFPRAQGRMEDFITSVKGGHAFEEKIAFQSAISARQSDMQKAKLSNVENSAIFDKALEGGDAVEIAAAGRVLIANNQTDDYAGHMGIDHSASSMRKHLKERMDKSLGLGGKLDKDTAANIAVSWAEYAEEVGKPRMWNLAKSHTTYKDGKPTGMKNTWIDEDYARELQREEGKDTSDKAVNERLKKELSGEWRTKADRAGNTAFIRGKEGKQYLIMKPKAEQVQDILTDEMYPSNYVGYDEEGAKRAAAEDDNMYGQIIDARPQEGQSRLKEIIGAQKVDGKLRINGTILKEAFTKAKIPHQAVALLASLLKDDPTKIASIQNKLQQAGVKNDDGTPIEFMRYANKVGAEALKKAGLTSTAAGGSAPASAPVDDTSSAPAGSPAPRGRMAVGFDVDKHARTKAKIDEFEQSGLEAEDFYRSSEFNPQEHEARVDFSRHEAALNQSEFNKMRGVKTASTREAGAKQAGVGVNFDDPAIQKALGVKSGQGAVNVRAQDKEQTVAALTQQYRQQLQAENKGKISEPEVAELRADVTKFYEDKGLKGDELNQEVETHIKQEIKKRGGLARNEADIEAEVGKLQQGLTNAKSIRIHNNNSSDSRRDQADHELAHETIDQLKPEQVQSIWQSVDKKQQEAIMADVSKRYQGLSKEQQIEEAVVEMVGVGKGDYAVSDKTVKVLRGMNIKTKGDQTEEKIEKLSARAAKRAAAKVSAAKADQMDEEFIQESIGDIKAAIGSLLNVPAAQEAKRYAAKIIKSAGGVIRAIKDRPLNTALSGLMQATESHAVAKAEREEVEQAAEKDLPKFQNQRTRQAGLYQDAVKNRDEAIASGNTAGAESFTQKANVHAGEIKKIDAAIEDLKKRIDQARLKESKAIDGFAQASRKINEIQAARSKPKESPAGSAPVQAPEPQRVARPTSHVGKSEEEVIDIDNEIGSKEKQAKDSASAGDYSGAIAALNAAAESLAAAAGTLEKKSGVDKNQIENLRKGVNQLRNPVMPGRTSEAGIQAQLRLLAESKTLLANILKELKSSDREENNLPNVTGGSTNSEDGSDEISTV